MGQSLKKLSKNGAPKNEVNEKDRKRDKEICLKPLSALEAYRFIQGRKFRLATNVALTLPSDNEEALRFNDSIKLLKKIFDSNYSAPVTKLLTCGGARVLEIGTSGGSWLNEISIKFPMSIFLGMDVSTIFNPDCLPENCAFLEHNYHDGIPFPDDIYGSPTHIVDAGPATERFILATCKCLQVNGLNPDIVHTIPEKLKRLNIKNIQVAERPLSLSRHNAITGDQMISEQNLLLKTVEAYRVIMKVAIGCTDEEYDKLKRDIAME
ncbi:556_t:CDS:2, partial [Cetraspora pellucida]